MKVLVVGGSGFIGKTLCSQLLKNGAQVSVLTRSIKGRSELATSINFITGLEADDNYYDVIINLAGEPLNKKRWNEEVKKNIYGSRIQTTQKIINFIKKSKLKPKLLISGSAVGYYGNHDNQIFTEESIPTDNGFTHKLCADWEKTAEQALKYGVRVCLLRTGIVLGKDGGALKEMTPPFNFGLGAKFGNGKQWMSWIHMEDAVGAIIFLMNNDTLTGPFNLTAPEATNNQTFSSELAAALHRPCFLTMPKIVVEMLFGEMGKTLLLNGQNVVPSKLLNSGYQFKFPNVSGALENILKH